MSLDQQILTRIVYLNNIIAYACNSVNDLMKLRLVNSSWDECIRKYSKNAWERVFKEKQDLLRYCVKKRGPLWVIELLLTRTNVNQTDDKNRTILHYACHQGRTKCVEMLLRKGANVHIGVYPLNITPLHNACASGSIKCVELLLKYGANIEKKNENRQTALYYALAKKDNKAIVELLLENGANINVVCGHNITVLHFACLRGDKECTALFLQQKGLYIDAKDKNDCTPLHYACMNGHKECAKLLLRHGANINKTGNFNRTPLHFACLNGHWQCVKLLLENGANVHIIDYNDDIPLDIARDGNHTKCIILLEPFIIRYRTSITIGPDLPSVASGIVKFITKPVTYLMEKMKGIM
jgi:ankyrin repeat protein